VRVAGRWCYLYRAIDRDGNLVDVRLSESRDRAAAEAFFASARAVTGITPSRVTIDGHDAYPGAIRTELGKKVTHRTSRYLNNHLEQDHRGIKGRSRPMHGFKSVVSAERFCRAYDEVRHFLRPPSPRRRRLSLDARRWSISAGSIGSSPSWSKPPDRPASAALRHSQISLRRET
jgi:transposase-like protein